MSKRPAAIIATAWLVFTACLTAGCALSRIDLYHPYLRSDTIQNLEAERAVLEKASLHRTDDGRVRVLVVRGTPYERGYQQGALLRSEVRANLQYMYNESLKTFKSEELFAESFDRLRPHIPERYMQEMRGLAHGSKLPLRVIHHIHALPSMSEWGGKKKLKKLFKKMVLEGLETSCSNFSILPKSDSDPMFVVRILDWGLHRISKLHEHPLITVNVPDEGYASANVGWVGFLGSVSGMNVQGITLGEMGYGHPENERLDGMPMIFLLREIMRTTESLEEVESLIAGSRPTNSFVYLMSDGKRREARLYVRDSERFLRFEQGQDLRESKFEIEGIPGVVYGGHFFKRMTGLLSDSERALTLERVQKELIPEMAMHSNFHNVIYRPDILELWVSNARDSRTPAAGEPYSHFRFGDYLKIGE